MTAVNVPMGSKAFRKMLLVDPTFSTPQAPIVSDADAQPGAPKQRRREPDATVATQGAMPLMTSTPIRRPTAARMLNYEEDGESDKAASEMAPPPAAPPAAPPQHTADRPPAIVAHVNDAERFWVTEAGRCIPPNIPNAKKTQWMKLLERLELTKPFKPTACGEVQVRNTDDPDMNEWNTIRGSNYLDVLRALMVDAGYEAAGLCEAVEAVKKAGIPASMLGSALAKQLYTLGHVHAHGGPGSAVFEAIPGKAPRVLRVNNP
jgi:hypothetical protein